VYFPLGEKHILRLLVPVRAENAGGCQDVQGGGPVPVPGKPEAGQGAVPGKRLQTGRFNRIE
jgi:hypothetical protein